MAEEIELKLLTSSAAAAKAARLPWLRRLASGPAQRRRLVTVYFDTASLKLRRHRIAIRIRHVGEQRLQTIKAASNGESGAFGRHEWEQEIAGDAPDLSLAKGTALAPLVTKKLVRKLKPVFETVIERTALPIRSGGSELELAIDRGQIRAHGGGEREAVSEIEIELKRGDPAELARVARRLARSVPVAYGARSKAERGYALIAGEADEAVRAAEIDLDARLAAGEAFQAIGLACLDHALSNERAARAGDVEGVHQMRVGLRRLRAAISVFKEMVQGPRTESLKADLKWLTDQLSPVRDLDVLIEERVRPLRKAAPIAAEAGVLEQDLDARRKARRERAKEVLESGRYRAIGLRAALWLADGAWLRSDDALVAACRARPAAEFAAEALARRTRKIVRKARRIETLDVRARHKLRIAVKKLRYACEFFSGLFAGAKRQARLERFAKTLNALQSTLGTLHDIEIHEGLAATIARPRRPAPSQAREALAMGFIAGQEQKQAASCVAAIEDAAARLSRLPAFWK